MNFAISDNLQTRLNKVFWITIAWVFVSIGQFLNGYGAIMELDCDLSGRDPILFFKGSIFTGIIAGLLGGSLMVFSWEQWLRAKNYGIALLDILWSFTVVYFIVGLLSGFFLHGKNLEMTIFELELWQTVLDYMLNVAALQGYFFWLLVVLSTFIFLQVNDKYGPGTFRSFLLGKYFRPQREERIFMFLDLRSSTTIAEKLGERRYFNFLNDLIKHVTPPILSYKGEIYQYVGDEIVVSWQMSHGINNANCLNCFLDIQKALKHQESYYRETYNLSPEFKAGLHYGHVMTGEIGVVKRDIAFSGDVLNTTSRIQSKCNDLGVDILLSQRLLDQLTINGNGFQPKQIGEITLRGKEQKLMLVTV